MATFLLATTTLADTREYQASLGSLPTAQGWHLFELDGGPSPTVAAGVLHQGPTVSTCGSGGYQYYVVNDIACDFANSVAMEANLRVIASNDVSGSSMGCPGSPDVWRAGYYLQLTDVHEHVFYVGITQGAVFLANNNSQDPNTCPRRMVDTTQFHTYRITVVQNVATLYYDDSPIDWLPVGTDLNPGAGNNADFGDTSHMGGSTTELTYARFTTASDIVSFCAGDGSLATACPCANLGGTAHGCGNSTDNTGALLSVIGTSNPDTLLLQASGMPAVATPASIYLQGDAIVTGGVLFGDGVRCVGGNLIRLGLKAMPTGSSQYPEPGDQSVSTKGGVTPGTGVTRYYQTYYRNSSAIFCPPATFNVTNGLIVVW
jgi:hypothetical protein